MEVASPHPWRHRYLLIPLLSILLLTTLAGAATFFRPWLSARAVPIGSTYRVTTTAYASSPYQTDSTPCITAAGTVVRPGIIATNFLPLGTIVTLEPDTDPNTDPDDAKPVTEPQQAFIVEDRTNPRYNSRVDIWMPSTSQALEYGIKPATITVIGHTTPGQPVLTTKPTTTPPPTTTTEPETTSEITTATTTTIQPTELITHTWQRVANISRLFNQFIKTTANTNHVNQHDVDCTTHQKDT